MPVRMINFFTSIIIGLVSATLPALAFNALLDYWNKRDPLDKTLTPNEVESEITRRSSICVWLLSAIGIALFLWFALEHNL
jgi:hypothetical protein